jgi:serine/threonine protein phosphatase PrpC
MVTATIYAASVLQPGRPNEDAFFIGRLPNAPLAAVFDGQGNAEGAAKKAARQLERLYMDGREQLDWTKTAKLLDSHLMGANKSTMVGTSIAGDAAHICSVGNSRIYLARNGQVEILTEGADKRQLGAGNVAPFVREVAVQDRDVLLLMTDGAWTKFSPYLLSQVVMKNLMRMPELPESILKQAGTGGICDDMTVSAVLIRRG